MHIKWTRSPCFGGKWYYGNWHLGVSIVNSKRVFEVVLFLFLGDLWITFHKKPKKSTELGYMDWHVG